MTRLTVATGLGATPNQIGTWVAPGAPSHPILAPPISTSLPTDITMNRLARPAFLHSVLPTDLKGAHRRMEMTFKRASLFTFALALLGLPAMAGAQAFGLNELRSCAVSRGFATTAAPCDDASSTFWNPG